MEKPHKWQQSGLVHILHERPVRLPKSRQEHWEIIVSKQFQFRETMSRLLRLLQRNAKETMKNHLEFL